MAGANGTKSGSSGASTGVDGSPKDLANGSNAGRRERKQKFDLKKLFNLRGTNASGNAMAAAPAQKAAVNNSQKTRRSGRVKSGSISASATASPNPSTATNGNSESSSNKSKKDKDQEPLVLGKRERKRKVFWDEQDNSTSPAPPPTKLSKKASKKSNASTSSTNSPSSQPLTNATVSSSSAQKSSSSVTSKSGSSSSAKKESKARALANGAKTLEYLDFDMALEPAEVAKHMVEGVNIPGPGVPIPIDSSSLPSGWEKRVIQRNVGITKGKWDVFILSPEGKSFRSKIELQKHFDEKKLPHKSEHFDFSLDDHLKRLRQIWKQHILLPREKKLAVEQEQQDQQLQQQANATSKSSKKSAELSAKEATDHQASSHDQCTSPVPDLGVESETGQGIRCSIEKCGKLFRNDNLLQMHIKHYHPQVFESLPGSQAKSVTQLAQSRTTFSEQQQQMASGEASNALGPPEAVSDGLKKKRKSSTDRLTDRRSRSDDLSPAISSSSSKRQRLSQARKLSMANNEDDDVFRRTRNDSTLSMGSDSLLEEVVGGNAPTGSTPPTFRVSKRRQAQLKKKLSPVLKMNRLEDMDEFSNFVRTPDQTEASLAEGSAPSSYPPSEMDVSVASEHLTSEEVVNCTCKRTEEDGLMIQCDICLCWQHGYCLGLDEEDQVPEKYICQICRDPPGGRSNSGFSLDLDWLKEGKFNSVSLPKKESTTAMTTTETEQRELAFKKLSELMADLANMHKVLHSIRVKLLVASQSNNSKVFMWSAVWERQPEPELAPAPMDANPDPSSSQQMLLEHLTSTVNSLTPTATESTNQAETLLTQPPTVNGTAIESNESTSTSDKMTTSNGIDTNDSNGPVPLNDAESIKSAMTTNEVLELDNLDPSMIPTVSEVERLLPSIIQESLVANGDLLSSPPVQPVPAALPPPPPPPIIPEQKRIDKDDCRMNLLSHIEYLQTKVTGILDHVEEALRVLEDAAGPVPLGNHCTPEALAARTKSVANLLTQDLYMARRLMSAVKSS